MVSDPTTAVHPAGELFDVLGVVHAEPEGEW
jgi:hypothetical protein